MRIYVHLCEKNILDISMKYIDRLVKGTGIPIHAHALICSYFEIWPQQQTQEEYKKMGALCSQYWFHELKRILSATVHFTEEFQRNPHLEYYIQKYPQQTSMNVADLTQEERTHILRAFTTQLGMHWNIFPYSIKDFECIH